MRDQSSELKVIQLFPPTTITNANTATVSSIIDRLNFDALTLAIVYGGLTDANVTSTVLVEEGDQANMSDAAAVADAQLIGTEAGAAVTFADDNKVAKIGYKGSKRYVRVTVTPVGNDAGAYPFAGVAILGNPATAPQSTQIV